MSADLDRDIDWHAEQISLTREAIEDIEAEEPSPSRVVELGLLQAALERLVLAHEHLERLREMNRGNEMRLPSRTPGQGN